MSTKNKVYIHESKTENTGYHSMPAQLKLWFASSKDNYLYIFLFALHPLCKGICLFSR